MLHINVTTSARNAFHHVAFFYLCKVTRVTTRMCRGNAHCFALCSYLFLSVSLSPSLVLSLSLGNRRSQQLQTQSMTHGSGRRVYQH